MAKGLLVKNDKVLVNLEPFTKKKLKKSRTMPKNLKREPFGLVRYCMLRGNLFGSVPWANRYNLASSQNFVELLVELFWSLQVILKNTDENP